MKDFCSLTRKRKETQGPFVWSTNDKASWRPTRTEKGEEAEDIQIDCETLISVQTVILEKSIMENLALEILR